jgi:hypothetical protein
MNTTSTTSTATEVSTKLDGGTLSKFVPDGDGTEELANKLMGSIVNILKPILEPVQVSYSNVELANQIQDIGIILFILIILIMFLIVALLINIFVLIFSDKIINYFNNKYIKMYLNFTKKFVALEVFVLGSSILYFMYSLSLGVHFIATHPIKFT